VCVYCCQQYEIFCSLTAVQRKPVLAFAWRQLRVGQRQYKEKTSWLFRGSSCYTNMPQCFLCVLDRASSWYLNKGWPTRWHLLYYILLNMFQMLIHPSSGACDYLLHCVGWLEACWCYVAGSALGYHITNRQSHYITPARLKSAYTTQQVVASSWRWTY